jgi:hypothetical protein
MSFVTDFETHAIWQGYVKDPAAKDFLVRKARTIALSEAQGSCHKTSNNQPIHELDISLVFPYLLRRRALAHAKHMTLYC